jgi:hypothetical protein
MRILSSMLFSILMFLACASVSLTGCGSKEIPTTVSETAGMPEAKDALLDLAELLKRLAAGNMKPPTDAAGFVNYDVEHPAIATLISNGLVVYNFGATIDGTKAGDQWVAMQSNAKEKGGWVLLNNGEIRDMQSAEVAALKPAGK